MKKVLSALVPEGTRAKGVSWERSMVNYEKSMGVSRKKGLQVLGFVD
jgi:hypothetical protein